MGISLTCKECGEKLTFETINTKSCNIDGTKLREFCEVCAKKIEIELKQQYFLQSYNRFDIYCRDKKYFVGWGREWFLDSIWECRQGIDNLIEKRKPFLKYRKCVNNINKL